MPAAQAVFHTHTAQLNQQLADTLIDKQLVTLGDDGKYHLVKVSQTAPTITVGADSNLVLYTNHLPPISSTRHTVLKRCIEVGSIFMILVSVVGMCAGAFLLANFCFALGSTAIAALSIFIVLAVCLPSAILGCKFIADKLIDKINLSLQEKKLTQLVNKTATLRTIIDIWVSEIYDLRSKKLYQYFDQPITDQDWTYVKDKLMEQALLYGEDNRFNKDAFDGTKDLTKTWCEPGANVYQCLENAILLLITGIRALKNDETTFDSIKNRSQQLSDDLLYSRTRYEKSRILLGTSHDAALQDLVECHLMLPNVLWPAWASESWALFLKNDSFRDACIRFLGLDGAESFDAEDVACIKNGCHAVLNKQAATYERFINYLPLEYWDLFFLAHKRRFMEYYPNDITYVIDQELLDKSELFMRLKFYGWMLSKVTVYEENAMADETQWTTASSESDDAE